jgi:lysyl-tRNA synthetase class 2
MKLTEDLYEFVCKKVLGTTKVKYQGVDIDFKKPWARITMLDAIKEYAGIDAERMSDDDLQSFIDRNKVEFHGKYNRGLAIAAIFEHFCESKFIQPTFIMHHPKETTPLCKELRGHPELIERFESFVNGWEVGNAYSELNNPLVQKRLFEEQVERGRGGDEEAHQMDEDFVRALEYGMPPTGGLGLGIDRMVILLTNSATIRDVILFPTMRNEMKKQ